MFVWRSPLRAIVLTEWGAPATGRPFSLVLGGGEQQRNGGVVKGDEGPF